MKSKTKGVVCGVVAAAIIVAGVGALGCATSWFKDWDTKNWGDNFKDTLNLDKDPTEEKVDELEADETVAASTYVLPNTLNFGKDAATESTDSETTTETAATTNAVKNDNLLKKELSINDGTTVLKSVSVKALLTPTDAEFDSVEWTVAWKDLNSTWATGKTVTDYVTVTKGENLNATITCKLAFSEPVILKVKVTKAEISVADTCVCQFYKALTGLNLAFTNDMTDNVLAAGDNFEYTATDVYGDGTKLLATYGTLTSVYASTDGIKASVNITENFDNYKDAAFDYDVFYGNTTKFTFVDSTIAITSGKGRNLVNTLLDGTAGDFTFKVTKGSITSNVLTFDIAKEGVIYPESVTIGDGSDITL